MFKNNYSPKTNKIIYYEDNHKLLKKRKNRISIGKILIFDSSSIKENDLNYTNKKNQRNINVKDNHNLNKSNEIYDSSNKIIYKNYTQPVINRNNNKINITSINEIDSIKEFGLLNDFFNELEDNENNNDKENNFDIEENDEYNNDDRNDQDYTIPGTSGGIKNKGNTNKGKKKKKLNKINNIKLSNKRH